MVVCSAWEAESLEGARFCNGCGAPLTAQPAERRKLVTLLFCDMTGSTAASSTRNVAIRARIWTSMSSSPATLND